MLYVYVTPFIVASSPSVLHRTFAQSQSSLLRDGGRGSGFSFCSRLRARTPPLRSVIPRLESQGFLYSLSSFSHFSFAEVYIYIYSIERTIPRRGPMRMGRSSKEAARIKRRYFKTWPGRATRGVRYTPSPPPYMKGRVRAVVVGGSINKARPREDLSSRADVSVHGSSPRKRERA